MPGVDGSLFDFLHCVLFTSRLLLDKHDFTVLSLSKLLLYVVMQPNIAVIFHVFVVFEVWHHRLSSHEQILSILQVLPLETALDGCSIVEVLCVLDA